MQKPITSTPIPAHTPIKPKSKLYQYDRTFILAELNDMLTELRAHEGWKSKAELFRDRPYSYSKFNGWKSKYDTNANIHERIKKIEEILESRLVEQGLAGKSIPMTIFLLKNYYNYTDQYQVKQDTSVTFKVTRGHAPINAEIVTPKQLPKPTRP